MTRKRTAAEIGDMNIDGADRESKRHGPAREYFSDQHILRRLAPVRVVPLPEPADTGWVGWRPPGGFTTMWPFCQYPPMDGGWEERLLTGGRLREGAAGLGVLGGLTWGAPCPEASACRPATR